ncbi:MAG TPA: LLM class flavin-dependent oxidoreductase [Acidimicrobiia bacterium]|nr:LLM class flavin-dependent oxidoreductase [Acidimicrobiia bacterium]
MPRLSLHYDLRHPGAFGVSGKDLYAAALDQIAWADAHGFTTVGFGEHHQSPDGYLPSPLLVAAAVAARTTRIRCQVSTILAPLYDPIHLAEDIAVVDNLLGGRLDVAIAAGYVRDDFDAFGKDYAGRGQYMEEIVPFLRAAWTGEPFEHEGRTVRVTPRPVQDPMPILMGGSVPATIRRAARLADGYRPPMPGLWKVYREACAEVGKPDPGPLPRQGPIFLWVVASADKNEDAWARLTPHILHQINSYAEWTHAAFGQASGPFVPTHDVTDVRQGGAYQVCTPEETVELAASLGDDGDLRFSPLLAGIEPAWSNEMLALVERAVLPAFDR